MGSGTAAVVAQKLGRNFCGIEINHEYCLWSVKRLVKAIDDKAIQGYADGVFWERNSLGDQKKQQITQKKSSKKKEIIDTPTLFG